MQLNKLLFYYEEKIVKTINIDEEYQIPMLCFR